MDKDFSRIERLPRYVFEEINQLKIQARHDGKDIIDFGMGNPDQATPDFIVNKLTETVNKKETHRYSQSKGIPRLRKAISDWYDRKYNVAIDPENEAIVTMGSKEGLGHLALATMDKGDVILVPNPSYPIHPLALSLQEQILDMFLLVQALIFLINLKKQLLIHFLSQECLF